MSFWTPQPGPQALAAVCPCKVILYGGSRGGGKSDTTIGRHIAGAGRYGPKWNGLIIRRRYRELKEIRRRVRELMADGLPAELIGGDNQPNVWRFHNGARVDIEAVQRIEDVDVWQGQQKTGVSIEEATTFSFIGELVEKLKGCIRSPHGVPTSLFMTANPGGPGHSQVKAMMIDPAPPGQVFLVKNSSYVFIPSKVYDNKILCQNDPGFVDFLESISDPVLRDAWLNGNWDIFEGQAFSFKRSWHVIEPHPIPDDVPIMMTYDWGWGAPFSIGWWYKDGDGRLIRFAEWYGWSGKTNVGIKMRDEDVATGILDREAEMNIAGQHITRYAGHDCWNRKADYKDNDPGPSTAEVFASMGLYLTKANADRRQKIRQFRSRLHVETEDGKPVAAPMLQVFDTCTHFIRTVPDLAISVTDPEDIDDDQEDHIYDEAAQVCMAYPLRRVGRTVERVQRDSLKRVAKREFFS